MIKVATKKASGIEKRKFVRAQRVLGMQHRLYKRKGKIYSDHWQLSTTENMSVSGLLFNSRFLYQAGDIVDLHVVMAGVLDIFKCLGKVVRVDPTKNKFVYFVAVKFLPQRKENNRSAKRY